MDPLAFHVLPHAAKLTRQQRLTVSFFIGQWSVCQDKDNPWTREVFAGIWRKYGVKP